MVEDHNKSANRLPKIPSAVALLGLTFAAAAAISVPLAVTALTGAKRSVNTSLNVLQNLSVNGISKNVVKLTNTCFSSMDDMMAGTTLRSFVRGFTANSSVTLTDYQHLPLEFMNTADRWNTTAALYTVRNGLVAESWFVPTNNSFGKLCSGLNSTHVECKSGILKIEGNKLLEQYVHLDVISTTQDLRERAAAFVTSSGGSWGPTKSFMLGNQLYIGMPCLRTFWLPSVEPPSGENFDLQFMSMFSATTLHSYFLSLTVTPNTVMALFEPNGYMLSTNRENMHINAEGTGPALIGNVSHSDLRTAARDILHRFQNWSAIPSSFHSTVYSSGNKLFLTTKRITENRGLDTILLIVIPENDLTDQLKHQVQSAITSVIITTLVMVALGIGLSYLIFKPLRSLSAAMRAAANLDFSAMPRQRQHKHEPIWTELAALQERFFFMQETMAKAVEDNRNLIRLREQGRYERT